MAESTFTQEEEQAGIRELGSTFGFYATLDRIARYMHISDSEALKMSFYEFYLKVVYLSHVSEYQKNYSEILKRSNK